MRVLVTAGPTHEHWDDVRFLGNASTGRMGYAVARAATARGHEAVLVVGPTLLAPPDGLSRAIRVTSAREMLAACAAEWPECDALVATAAVCDYRPRTRVEGKRTKSAGPVTLELVRNPDVLGTLAAAKGRRVCVGFALQVDDALTHARRKLVEKHLDAIVVDGPEALGADAASFRILTADGSLVDATGSKDDLASRLIDLIESVSAGRDG